MGLSSQLKISTPRFGACRDANTNRITKCALGPKDCSGSANSVYAMPGRVEGGVCDDSTRLNVGRCASNVDNNICAADAGACQIAHRYTAADDSCTLIEDSQSSSSVAGASTRYPYCTSTAEGNRCVLNGDQCPDDSVLRPVSTLPWESPCYCHHVSTGACFLGSQPMTADTTFCAVGPYDCPSAYSFLSDSELLAMENPPVVCRLCEEAELDNLDKHPTVVESGGCYSGDAFKRCALENKECASDGTTFRTSVQVRRSGHVPCDADHFKGGYCESSLDEVRCTNVAEACVYPERFVPNDVCTLHTDLATKIPAYFGECREQTAAGGDWLKYRCSWQSSECVVGLEGFRKVRLPETWFDGCNCEHVRTGACAYDGNDDNGNGGGTRYACAVSEQGCSEPSDYVRAVDLIEKGIDCRLCQPSRKALLPTPNPTTEAHGKALAGRQKEINGGSGAAGGQMDPPSSDGDGSDSVDSADAMVTDGNSSTSSTDDAPKAEVIGLAVGGGLVLFLAVISLFSRRRKRAKYGQDKTEDVHEVEAPSPDIT